MIYAVIASIGFLLVSIFQFAVLLGAPLGEYTQGGQTKGRLNNAGRIGALVSIILLGFMSLSLLAKYDIGFLAESPEIVQTVAIWFTFIYAIIGFVINWISRSKKERYIWGPIATVLLVLVSLAIFSN